MPLAPSRGNSWQGQGPLRVVLLCAEETSPELGQLMANLHLRDIDFDYVGGVELDSRLALSALSRHQDDALYVICQDQNLDDYSAAHLHDTLLRSCSIDSSQILTLPVQPGRSAVQAGALASRAELLAPTHCS